MMLTRLHISFFVGLTIMSWLVILWFQGAPVLSFDFIKPYAAVTGFITIIWTLFNKCMWSWKIFKGWFVKRPDLRGTWKVELKSNWINPKTDERIPPIHGYAVIRQSLTFLSLRLMTMDSSSSLVSQSIEQQKNVDLFKLVGVYRNEPKIELQGVISEIHYGSFFLEIHGSPVEELEGHYWTDRGTKGEMKLFGKTVKLYSTYEQAKREWG